MTISLQRQGWDTKGFRHLPVKFPEFESVTTSKGRFYKTPKGSIYPSVTTALGDMSAKSIQEWRKRIGEEEANRITTQATRRGTKLHSIVEKYCMNDTLYLEEALPSDVDLFNKVKKVLDQRLDTVFCQEFPLYSDVLKCAGRCDLFGMFDGSPCVVDFKSAAKAKKEEHIVNYKYQATAYCMMINEQKNVDIQNFSIIIASEEMNAQVFSGNVRDYRNDVIDYFQEYYKRNIQLISEIQCI